MRAWLSGLGSLVFVGACAGASSSSNCEPASTPEPLAIAAIEPIDEEQQVYARWIALGDSHDFEWLEWRIHVRLDQSPRDLARWAELARLHLDRAVRDEDPSALAQVALILADADRIGGDSLDLEVARGLLAQLEGRHDHAVAAWQRAVDLDPLAREARLRLGIACLEHRDFARAAAQLGTYVELEPTDADGWLALGVAYAHTGKRPSARGAYQRAAELAPEDPRPHWNLAWMSQDSSEVESNYDWEMQLWRAREHLADLFVIVREHPLPDCEALAFPEPQCVAAFEQRRELERDAAELDLTAREAIDTIAFWKRPHYDDRPKLTAEAAKAEAARRQKLLEMEKAAMAADQVPRE
jgi:tetratricopeptide (TPR) repeat protein